MAQHRSTNEWPAPVTTANVLIGLTIYALALLALRLALSPYLDVDEAQFMANVDLRFVYGNSHPPLYNWLVRGMLELTGWHWPAALYAIKAALIFATYALLFDAGRRAGGLTVGLLTVAFAALCPQVSWMASHTLAHSTLVMAAAAGVTHALVLIAARPSPGAFAWLGLWAAIGLMAKYNHAILLAAVAVAVLTDAAWRKRFARPSAWLAVVVPVALVTPSLIAALAQLPQSTERLEKLYRDKGFGALDVPFLGVDGLASLIIATLAWGGIAFAVGVIALRLSRRRAAEAAPQDGVRDETMTFFFKVMAIGWIGAAVAVLLGDVSHVYERYLTPLLMPLPLVLALWIRASRLAKPVVLIGAVAMLAVPIGLAGMVAFGDHRYARPYGAIATAIADALPEGRPVTVAAGLHDRSANIALALRRRGIDARVDGDRLSAPAGAMVVVWSSGNVSRSRYQPPNIGCFTGRHRATAPLTNWSGRTETWTFDVYSDADCAAPATPAISESR